MVGTNRSTRCHIALTFDQCRTQEGVIMVLLVRRENKRIKDLTTGDGRIVAQERVDQSGAIFQLRIG